MLKIRLRVDGLGFFRDIIERVLIRRQNSDKVTICLWVVRPVRSKSTFKNGEHSVRIRKGAIRINQKEVRDKQTASVSVSIVGWTRDKDISEQRAVRAIFQLAKSADPVIHAIEYARGLVVAISSVKRGQVFAQQTVVCEVIAGIDAERFFFVFRRISADIDLIEDHIVRVGQVGDRRRKWRVKIDSKCQRVSAQIVAEWNTVIVTGSIERTVRVDEVQRRAEVWILGV